MFGAPFGSMRSISRVLWGEEAAAEAPFADCVCLDLRSPAGKEYFRRLLGLLPLKEVAWMRQSRWSIVAHSPQPKSQRPFAPAQNQDSLGIHLGAIPVR